MKKKLLCVLLSLMTVLTGLQAFAASEDEFIFGMVYESGAAINPLYCNQRDLISLNELVFESVIALDDSLKPRCELAFSYSVSGKEFTFNLRQNVMFHDGNYLSAPDVLATYRRIMQIGENSPYYTRCSYISDMEVIDLYTLRVTGKYASYFTLYAMTFPVLESNSLDMILPTGTGPYWYMYSDTEWIQIDVNPYWWKKAPTVNTVYVFRYNETGEVLSALETREVDAVSTRSQGAALSRLLSDRVSTDYSTLTYEMLIPNLANEIFDDVRTRQAVMYAIDISTIAQNIYMNMVMETEVPVITGSWLYEPQSAIYYYSMERALQLLNEAGWGDYNGDGILDKVRDGILVELSFTITTYVDDNANTRQHAAQMIADQLRILGISVTVKTVSKSTLEKNLKNREFDMVLCAVNLAALPDLTFLLNSGGRMNYSGYSSADMNVLVQSLYKTTDEETFRACFSDIQILISEDLPFLGLFFRKGTLMTTADVTGFSPIIEGNALQGFEYIEFN